jgi:hypothetical protein
MRQALHISFAQGKTGLLNKKSSHHRQFHRFSFQEVGLNDTCSAVPIKKK